MTVIDFTDRRNEKHKNESEYAFDLVCFKTSEGQPWATAQSDMPFDEVMHLMRRLILLHGMEESDPVVATLTFRKSGSVNLNWDNEVIAPTPEQAQWLRDQLEVAIGEMKESTS